MIELVSISKLLEMLPPTADDFVLFGSAYADNIPVTRKDVNLRRVNLKDEIELPFKGVYHLAALPTGHVEGLSQITPLLFSDVELYMLKRMLNGNVRYVNITLYSGYPSIKASGVLKMDPETGRYFTVLNKPKKVSS